MSIRRPVLVFVLAFLVASGAMPAQADPLEHDEVERSVAGVKHPVDIAFGHDGHLYFASLTDRVVRRVALDTGVVDERFEVTFPDAVWKERTETGLFGIAMHPGFHANGVFYASYSSNVTGEWRNVLSRVTLLDRSGAADEEVLLTRPGGIFHNGGRVLVADGHLWWTTGDASDPFTNDPEVAGRPAQEDGVMRGKVLRLTLDGVPAEDNPWDDAAYTKGHRNVFGIAWDPVGKRMLATENGNAKADEVNLLGPGGNYGWPECEGRCEEPDPRFTDPVWQSESTVAPTGMAWFRGAFWFGTFNQGDVMRMTESDGEWVVEKVHHYGGTDKLPPRIVDVETGPDGKSVWFSTWDEIYRMTFPEDPDHPANDPRTEGPYWWGAVADVDPQGEDEPSKEAGRTTPAAGTFAFLIVLSLFMFFAARRRH
ncbi:MAG: PQQ-dependent sugar dehydrogenase [Euryarchaeota archaeon]|nr:PQQ-dependent sugar dehydrogenase [Euryarchaeota archaeon]